MAQEKARTVRSTRKTGSKLPSDRLLIERVSPEIDGGRYPIKRVVGDRIAIEADVIKDGHDLFAARICYRGPGDDGWSHAPLEYEFGPDRWHGSFVVDRVGRWQYTVEAWEDPFATWCDGIRKKFDAGQNIELELVEGALLVEAAARRAKGEARSTLREVAIYLRTTEAMTADRVRRATEPGVVAAMAAHVDHRNDSRYPRELEVYVDRPLAQFGAWYEFFPRSQGTTPGVHGTFADAARRLPRLAELGFDIVYLPPIHPVGHRFRKGPNNSLECGPSDPGSPWAIGNADGGHTAIEPKLGTIEDFDAFVRTARDNEIDVALDFALQCSPDHPWVEEHPDWFHVRPDGSIRYAENPPKKYQDIYPIHFWCDDRVALWNACRDALLYWVEHGVRVFRVDNPHTKPLAFWEWAIREVQDRHPEVIFLAEAFTRPKRLAALAKLGFTQSYGYFTWRNTAPEMRAFVEELAHGELAEFHRPNFFANTPDILHEYLQRGGRPAFRVRLVLAATLSPTYGIYSGYELCENVPVRPGSEEYLDSEKYQLRHRDWEAPGNLNADIATINRIRRENPALQNLRNVAFHTSENDQVLFYHRWSDDGANNLLIAVNVDPHRAQETMVHVPVGALGLGPDAAFEVEDLLTGARYTWRGARNYIRLDPTEQVAHVLRVTQSPRA